MKKILVQVENLHVTYKEKNILNNISFNIYAGELLCILGQSGSGKTMTSNALLNMLPVNVLKDNGSILYDGNIFSENIRGKFITTIMQSPSSCFDSVFTMRTQVKDILKANNKLYNEENVINILEKLSLKNPKEILDSYPFQLSGGMVQKVMIAVSLLLESKVIIADEPTSDLDVSSQKEILDLILKVKKENNAVLLITHNVSVAKYAADRVIVMNNGNIVDECSIDNLEDNNRNEYTKQLIIANNILYNNSWNINIGETYVKM